MDHERLCKLLEIDPTMYTANDYEIGKRIIQLMEDRKQLQEIRKAFRMMILFAVPDMKI